MRVFLGIALPREVSASLQTLQQSFHLSGSGIKWVSAGQMHITVKFFGEIAQENQEPLAIQLRRVVRQQVCFTGSLGPLGGFPSAMAPNVLWAGVDQGAASLLALAEETEMESRLLGFKFEERLFHPHVTLARIESAELSRQVGKLLQTVAWTAPPAWRVTQATLYRSTLSAEGPSYEVLEEFPFSK